MGGGGGGGVCSHDVATLELRWELLTFLVTHKIITLELPLMEYFNVVLPYVHTNNQTTLVIETTYLPMHSIQVSEPTRVTQ